MLLRKVDKKNLSIILGVFFVPNYGIPFVHCSVDHTLIRNQSLNTSHTARKATYNFC